MTRIRKVRARAVAVPLEAATAFSRRSVSERHYALVEVEGDDGVTGIGFCYAGHAGGKIVTQAIHSLLARKLVGEDAHRVEGLWEAMYQEALLVGRLGAVLRAISALDIALWDRNARAAGLPLHKYLGAVVSDKVPAYASGGYYLAGKTPEMLGEELAGYVRQGFRAVKIKVGREDLGLERARIDAARAAIGADVLLMLDANNAWSDLPTALRFMRIYEEFDPYWIEEPFGPDDIDNHARLARLTPVPVATGEIEGGRWRFKELLDKEAAGILQADACVCGGVTEFRRIAATAASYGVTLCPHWFHDVHAPLVAATPNARFVELFPDDKVLNFRRLIAPQLGFGDGMIELSPRPGLGCDFVAQAVERYAIEPWT